MKKILAVLPAFIVLFAFGAREIRAQDFVAGASASFRKNSAENLFDYRVENLKNFLTKYNSPLTPYAEDFVVLADTYGLDYRLVPSISGVESTFGKQIPYNSYNAYGWVNGNYSFESWPDSISVVSSTLKTQYIEKGAPTIAKIARRYAPPSTTWGSKVAFFIGKIDKLPLDFDII